jgi:hypothetical protein
MVENRNTRRGACEFETEPKESENNITADASLGHVL